MTGRGNVSNADVNEAYRRIVSDPDFDPSFSELIDTSEIGRLDLKSAGIRSFIAIWPFDNGRRVAYFGPKDFVYGLGRMAQGIGDMSDSSRYSVTSKRRDLGSSRIERSSFDLPTAEPGSLTLDTYAHLFFEQKTSKPRSKRALKSSSASQNLSPFSH